ncbi:hypothetical protein ABZP36_002473 [Zizania latifolia]
MHRNGARIHNKWQPNGRWCLKKNWTSSSQPSVVHPWLYNSTTSNVIFFPEEIGLLLGSSLGGEAPFVSSLLPLAANGTLHLAYLLSCLPSIIGCVCVCMYIKL